MQIAISNVGSAVIRENPQPLLAIAVPAYICGHLRFPRSWRKGR